MKIHLSKYNLQISSTKELQSYETKIHKLTTTTEENYILKVHPYTTDNYSDIEAENNILLALQNKLPFTTTAPIKNKEGKYLCKHENEISRVLNFIEGTFWADQKTNATFLKNLGTKIALIHLELKAIEPGAIKHRHLSWDLCNLMDNEPLLEYVTNPIVKKHLHYFFDQYDHFIKEKHHLLSKTLIHNDFNPHNVLVKDQDIIGLIDFGDMVYAPRINDLAIALSYCLGKSKDILGDSKMVIQAYHNTTPLHKEELDLLYHLIAGRIATSLVNSAKGRKDNPENSYIQISEQPYLQLLKQWIAINPLGFRNVVYQACDYSIPNNSDSKKKLKSRRKQHFTTSLSLSYEKPIHLSGAAFQYMYDTDGNTYLDAYNNIPIVGHSHPSISKVLSTKIRTLNTNTRYQYPELTEYADNLLSRFPSYLDKVFFINSGSAASDLAIRLANTHTNRKDIYVLEDGYHGNTQIGIDISHYKHNKKGGSGKSDHIHHFPLPKIFNNPKSIEEITTDAIKRFDTLSAKGITPAAFIAEPISGCGGQVPLPASYIKELLRKTKASEGLAIIDEVQIGFGRLGSWFWGFEMLDVQPDIVILGKPIGNGHPMAAVVCTSEVANSFNNGMEFFSSFGGNPISCAIGNEVLNIIDRENLQAHAKEVGDYWKSELKKLQASYPIIGDVRGEGLFLGIEIMVEGLPGTELAKKIKNEMKERFILTGTDGKYNNVIKVKPGMCFGKKDVDTFCTELKYILQNLIQYNN